MLDAGDAGSARIEGSDHIDRRLQRLGQVLHDRNGLHDEHARLFLRDRRPASLAPRLAAMKEAHRRLLGILRTDEAAVRARVDKRVYETRALRRTRTGARLHDRWYAKSLAGTLPLRAHPSVPDSALFVAADRLSRQLRCLPPAVLARLSRRGAAVHVIGRRQSTTDLPEYRHLKGVRGTLPDEVAEAKALDALILAVGRPRARQTPELRRRQQLLLPASKATLDERSRGMGGLQASCGEENLLAPEDELQYRGRCVLSHELSHTVMDHGLPPAVRTAIRLGWAAALSRGLWTRPDGTRAYAATSAGEYFAELSMWYWGTHGDFVDAKLRLPTAGPLGLARYDPGGFELVGQIWSGAHPLYAAEEGASCRLRPVRPDARPVSSAPAVEVELEVDNVGGDCDVDLRWVSEGGTLQAYGRVGAGAYHVQRTFAGHVWEVEAVRGDGRWCVSRFRVSRHPTSVVEAAGLGAPAGPPRPC